MDSYKKNVIVCVDDEEIILQSLELELQDVFADHTIELIDNGIDTLTIIRDHLANGNNISVVISDYLMPQITGSELLTKIHEMTPQTKKIMLTGHVEIEGITDAINNAELYRFIPKPWNKNDLILTVKEAIRSYKHITQIEEQNKDLQTKNFELELARDKAIQADRLKTAFLANISHEIRTPLNGIIGFSELLLVPDISEVQIQKYIKIIKTSGKQLLQIINDIMDVSKIEAGQVVLSSSVFYLNELLQELYDAFISYAETKDIELIVDSGLLEYNQRITCDRLRLKQVLTNLIGNAIKFTTVGKVEFGYVMDKAKFTFFVNDTGIGIGDDKKEIIFGSFNQAEIGAKRTFGGTGLGLTICKDLVTLMGGNIKLDSKVGKYSHFSVIIPVVSEETIEAEEVKFEDYGLNIQFKWNGKKIYVIDSDPASFLFLQESLSDTGAQIQCTTEKDKIFSVLENEKFDVILIDVHLSGIDPISTIKKIKKICKNTPVIALTSYAMKEDKKSSIAAGADSFITKPIIRHELLKNIDSYLSPVKI